MSFNLRYPILHWSTTLLLGPILFVTGAAIMHWGGVLADAVEILWLCLVFGLALSIPTLIVYLAVFIWLGNGRMTGWLLKGSLNVVAVSGIGITLFLLGGTLMPVLFWSYAAAVIVTSVLLRL
jgi:hypothetical protein